MKYAKLSDSIKLAIVEMIAAGEHQDEVALHFGISRWMVRRVLMEHRATQETKPTELQVREYLTNMTPRQRLKLFMSVNANASFG